MRAHLALAAVSLLALTACAYTPAERGPPLAGLISGPLVGASSPAVTAAEPEGQWWRLYSDPVLDRLVGEALANNRDLAAANANLEQVRAALSESRAGYLPSLAASAGYARGQTTAAQAAPGGRDFDSYSASFTGSYEFDLFGRVRNAVAAASADRDAAVAATDLVRLTVASETARAYSEACAANVQLGVAQRSLDLQTRTAELTRVLFENGRGNGLDIARAQSAVESLRASLPSLRAQRQGALFRLAVLTGKPPAQADVAAGACPRPPVLASPIPIGDGAGLIARRPDVRQAERQLASAAARTGVAAAALYPTITLGGQIGSGAAQAGDLGSGDSISFSLGPLISWSLPNLTASRARLTASEAGADAALARFDQTVLNALRDTETSLSNYAAELDRNAALRAARDQAANAVRLSQLRYDQGADSFLSLIDAQRTLAGAEAAVAQSDGAIANGQITLFQALGGGWQPAQ